MSVMRRNRSLAKTAATVGGFFRRPCPCCGVAFGGHEWSGVSGHRSAIPVEVRRHSDGRVRSIGGNGICPDCAAGGAGCAALAGIGVYYHDCEFAPFPDGEGRP